MNEPTQQDIEHAHGSVIHNHGVIGAGLHSHPGVPGEPEYDFYALVADDERLAEQRRRAAEGKRRYALRATTGERNDVEMVREALLLCRERRNEANLRILSWPDFRKTLDALNRITSRLEAHKTALEAIAEPALLVAAEKERVARQALEGTKE